MQAAMPDPGTRHHRIAERLDLRGRALQQHRLQAVIVVQVHVQRGHGQVVVGVVNVVLLAPIWMQVIHLLAADVLWIGFVLGWVLQFIGHFADARADGYADSHAHGQ